eukprot:CAMPEP_0198261442 /NCGR_PEP_ID=MMETSP1447-20131203/10167_1 /TAXON_ID=420782 /ORGANISM="Chaetoceros dichaeta, Strain CCMP1751" /LENGTH=261 /DNA_ID=CAMNT_0043949361 /DNA_START=186 /DNA_END=971 /DNA_ORIENTATION=+
MAVNRWMDFVWRQGGGLPLPVSPIPLDDDGGYKKRMLAPPFLVERIISIRSESICYDSPGGGPSGTVNVVDAFGVDDDDDDDDDRDGDAEITFTVDNPSIRTTFPAHSHFGSVKFRQVPPGGSDGSDGSDGGVEMVWKVTIRPMNHFQTYLTFFIKAVISTLARNFKVNLSTSTSTDDDNDGDDDDAGNMVGIYPPRGKDIGPIKGTVPLFQLRKDSWVGGVLSAHLSDQRGVEEQTKDMVRPWTWGVDEEKDDIDMEWTS